MSMKFYCDLYVSDKLTGDEERIIENLKIGKCLPFIYLITLARGERNHLEFFPALLTGKHIYGGRDMFVAGLASGYRDAVNMTRDIVDNVYKHTGGTDIKGYLIRRQKEFEESRGPF